MFWLDDPARPPRTRALVGSESCHTVVVGGGYTGLWAALELKRRDPAADVVVIEADSVGSGGSGRNGGFASASLTHGYANGASRFPREIERLQELGRDNLAGLVADVRAHHIDCELEHTGEVAVVTRPREVQGLQEEHALMASQGIEGELLDARGVRGLLDSPTYLAGLRSPRETVLVHPAKLAWGLRAAALAAGVRLYEHTPGLTLDEHRAGVRVGTPLGEVRAARAVLATNAFPPLLRAIRRHVLPVYDYVLMTEPLTPEQRRAIGWGGREGFSDSGNRFHYYRMTADHRILWGGYDAIYHYGNRVDAGLEQRWRTFAVLAGNFFRTFPQLEGLRFSHRWGGVIDTSSRFSVFFGTSLRGRAAYAVGYTGLGVAASRFGARVAVDLLTEPRSPLLDLDFVRRKPLPFPPEPLRYAAVQLTRRQLAREDETGRRGIWLTALDRFGLGFDS